MLQLWLLCCFVVVLVVLVFLVVCYFVFVLFICCCLFFHFSEILTHDDKHGQQCYSVFIVVFFLCFSVLDITLCLSSDNSSFVAKSCGERKKTV